MNGLTRFSFEGHEMRVEGTADEPLFCGNDLCALLEYADAHKAIAAHVPDDDRVKRPVIANRRAYFMIVSSPELATDFRFRIVLPIETPSNNKLLGMHPMARHRLSKKLAIVVALCGRGTPKATGKRYLTIERHGKRELDKDNAYGGCKPLIDAIKRCGLIIDDNPANVELEVVQVKLAKGEKPHTVIVLADCTDPASRSVSSVTHL